MSACNAEENNLIEGENISRLGRPLLYLEKETSVHSNEESENSEEEQEENKKTKVTEIFNKVKADKNLRRKRSKNKTKIKHFSQTIEIKNENFYNNSKDKKLPFSQSRIPISESDSEYYPSPILLGKRNNDEAPRRGISFSKRGSSFSKKVQRLA